MRGGRGVAVCAALVLAQQKPGPKKRLGPVPGLPCRCKRPGRAVQVRKMVRHGYSRWRKAKRRPRTVFQCALEACKCDDSGACHPRGRCLFPLPPAGTTPATPLWYCLCHSGPPPLPLWLLTAWPGGAAWCHAALGRGLVVVWLYERPGLAFPYPLRVHPVRCLPAAWLHSSVATSEPLVTCDEGSCPLVHKGVTWRSLY